jgi:hypothetical protein
VDASDPRNVRLPASFAGFCLGWALSRGKTRASRPASARVGAAPDSIIGPNRLPRIRRQWFRFDAGGACCRPQTACCSAHPENGGVNWSNSKLANRNNLLQRNLDHGYVLFVQHPLEKGRSGAVRSGSFIACAGVLGNCDRATEGGIPRSSRFRWFA